MPTELREVHILLSRSGNDVLLTLNSPRTTIVTSERTTSSSHLTMTSLPPVRRIITSHTSSGEPDVQDDSPMGMPIGAGTFHLAYVQKGLPADPGLALEGAKSMPDAGFTQSDGVIVGFLGESRNALHHGHRHVS